MRTGIVVEVTTADRTRLEAVIAENQARGQAALKSLDRSSDYPSDHLIGICIKAAARADQNSLRLP
jgi:hypothetical protein